MGRRGMGGPVGRRGVTSLLAMLYLVIFSALAVGFYGATTTSAQVSGNERRAYESLVAADSGVKFVRYHLSGVRIPPGLTPAKAFEELGMQLHERLDTQTNFATCPIYCGASEIRIPDAGYVALDRAGHKFRVSIKFDPADGTLILNSVGAAGSATSLAKAIQQTFARVEDPSVLWGFGVASRGPLTLSGGIVKGVDDASRGSVLVDNLASTAGISMSGSALISGSVSLVNPAGTVSGGGTIGTFTTPATWPVTKGVPEPIFPSVDPSPYVNYLATQTVTILTGNPAVTNLDNVRIKASANPTFKAGSYIRGVILIESPNKVSIPGGCTIEGVIVAYTPTAGGTNQIVFSGGSAVKGPENLPDSFGAIKYMGGGSILAPNFAVTMSGGSTSFGGTLLCSSLGLSGGSGGSTAGSVIMTTTVSQTWSGGSGFTFTGTGASKKPIGVQFTGHYEPVGTTYLEVQP
jgi:hypothetical protein